MSFVEKVKDTIATRAAEALAISVSVIIIWVASKVGPAILPALESNLSKELLITIFLASLSLNLILVMLFWVLLKKPDLRVKYGIYWDSSRNPHCPNCKIPIAGYSDYDTGGVGYYCKPCKKIFPLQDPAGNDINPSQVISEL